MKIISLEAENVKRLKAVAIRPNGNLVEITGRNGAGKTSVLDSIWWALAGTAHVQSAPIRKGETEAVIKLDLGELKVRRSFKRKEDGEYTTSIVVESADGMRATSPQKMLDALVGELSFDPLAFTRLDAKGQFEALKRFVPGVDFDAIEKANKADYEKRTDANRRAKEARTVADRTEIPAAPGAEIDEEALAAELEKAGEHNAEIETRKIRREQASDAIKRQREIAAAYRNNAADLRRQADEEAKKADTHDASVADLVKKFETAPALPEPIDTTALRAKLTEARRTNATITAAATARNRKIDAQQIAESFEAQSAALTKAMEKRSKDKQAAIAAAKMPVDGIEFGDGEILLNGVPFEQASDAEQLRASVAIAAAGNPKLRVIRVRDGSLLDEQSMTLLAEMATERDMQVWVETVASGRPGAIIIEDGRLAGAPVAQAAE